MRAADERAQAGGRLLREAARHLAVRMSYEDVIRVAAGQDRARTGSGPHRRRTWGPAPGEPVADHRVPQAGARGNVLASFRPDRSPAASSPLAERRAWLRPGCIAPWKLGRRPRSPATSGFWVPRATARLPAEDATAIQEERRAIERLARASSPQAARRLSGDLALEVAECARLIKGYGDTHKRGTGNYRLIEARVIAALAGRIPLRQGVDATASAGGSVARSRRRNTGALPRRTRRPP